MLFCVKADFLDDEVSLSFSGDNGVRSVILNGVIQYPLVQVCHLLHISILTKGVTHIPTSQIVACIVRHSLSLCSQWVYHPFEATGCGNFVLFDVTLARLHMLSGLVLPHPSPLQRRQPFQLNSLCHLKVFFPIC